MVAILASIPYWTEYFSSTSSLISTITVTLMIVGAGVGIISLRFLLPKYGVKAVFEHDILIVLIGLLFVTLAMNEAMLVVGLFVTMAALAVFFFENFKVQVEAARDGGGSILKLFGWALGPIVAIIVILSARDMGLLSMRLLFGHYILIGFWVWVQRLGLHMDYSDAPESVFTMVNQVRAHESIRKHEDAIIKQQHDHVIPKTEPTEAKDNDTNATSEAPKAEETKSTAAEGISVDSLNDSNKESK